MRFNILKSDKLDKFLNHLLLNIKKVNNSNIHINTRKSLSCGNFVNNNFSNLYNFLYESNKNNKSYDNSKKDININYFKKYCNLKRFISNNEFMSTDIKDSVLLDFNNLNIYSSVDPNIKLLYFSNNDNNDTKEIQKIFNIIGILKSLTNNKNLNNVIIFPTDFKKELPKLFKPLGPHECNSGATFYNSFYRTDNGIVILWRKEELYKVLIHELLHSMYCDVSLIDNDTKLYNKYYLNEVYIETLATIINCLIKTVKHNKDINYTKKLLLKEMNHSIKQVCKIMNFYGINENTFYNYFLNDFKENTNVFSYYVLKSALLFELPLFIDIIGQNLQLNANNINSFKNLVHLSFKSDKYKKIIDNCIHKYTDLDKSMTMTVVII